MSLFLSCSFSGRADAYLNPRVDTIDWRIHFVFNNATALIDTRGPTITTATAFNSPTLSTQRDGSQGLNFEGSAGPYLDITGNSEQPTGAQPRSHLYKIRTSTPVGINDRIFNRYGGNAANTLWESTLFNGTSGYWHIANNSNDRTFNIQITTGITYCIVETYDGGTTEWVYAVSSTGAVQADRATLGAALNTGTNQRFTIGGSELAAVLRSNSDIMEFAIAYTTLTRGQAENACSDVFNRKGSDE